MNFNEKIPQKPQGWNNDRLHFFKYMSFETAQIVLANRTLRWSTPQLMNDLYDVQIDLNLNLDLENLEELAHEKMWTALSGADQPNGDGPIANILRDLQSSKRFASREAFENDSAGLVSAGLKKVQELLPEAQRELREALESLKILCLTDAPTSPPMWAHYAQQNSGVVIRLRSIPALDSPYGMARPMRYLQEIPPLFDEEHFSNFFAGQRGDDIREISDRMIYSKGAAWSYENEWRLENGNGRNKSAPFEDIPFGPNDLDGVILGINMPSENRQTIINLAQSYPNVELLEAKRSSSGFHHDIVPIQN